MLYLLGMEDKNRGFDLLFVEVIIFLGKVNKFFWVYGVDILGYLLGLRWYVLIFFYDIDLL